jgi:hypothetical protein
MEITLILITLANFVWMSRNSHRQRKLEQAEVNLASFVLADIFDERNDDEDR